MRSSAPEFDERHGQKPRSQGAPARAEFESTEGPGHPPPRVFIDGKEIENVTKWTIETADKDSEKEFQNWILEVPSETGDPLDAGSFDIESLKPMKVDFDHGEDPMSLVDALEQMLGVYADRSNWKEAGPTRYDPHNIRTGVPLEFHPAFITSGYHFAEEMIQKIRKFRTDNQRWTITLPVEEAQICGTFWICCHFIARKFGRICGTVAGYLRKWRMIR